MKVSACVRSGFCCRKAPCPFGEREEGAEYCKFLSFDDNEIAECLNYENIQKDPSSFVSPAFGYGCCMSIGNSLRDKIISRDYGGEIPMIEIEGVR